MAGGSVLRKVAILALAAILLLAIVFVPNKSRVLVEPEPLDDGGTNLDSSRTPPQSVPLWSDVQANLDKMISVSQEPNIDLRGEWQKRQVEYYCKKYGLDDSEYTLPSDMGREKYFRRKLYRHLIFDDKQKILFCFIPKVGCTNMRRFLFLNQGLIPEKVLSLNLTDYDERAKLEGYYLQPSISKASFEKKTLTDVQRVEKVKHYYKFTFVRNPLERLLSAYLDKIAPPLRFHPKRKANPDVYQVTIIRKYRSAEYMKWNSSNGTYELRVTFAEYIRWIIDADKVTIDEHYAPLIVNAQPCRIKYDFYGNFKLYDSEMGHLIKKFDANPKYFNDASDHKSGQKTEDLVDQYYSQLPQDLKQKLFQSYYQELDFYYHLYPEDSLSHVHILGVQQIVK